MNLKDAEKHLTNFIQSDNSLADVGKYIDWDTQCETARVDGNFTADELEAVALWMRKYYHPTMKVYSR